MNQCSFNDVSSTDNSSNRSKIGQKSIEQCSAYPTQELAGLCNGKNECIIKLAPPVFKYGFMGSNCNFTAEILTISYECLPGGYFFKFKNTLQKEQHKIFFLFFNKVSFNLQSIPKYNICPGGTVYKPIHGYIHSPNYPNSYDSGKFCQLTLNLEEHIQRFEIYLIDMKLEDISKRTFEPTDYLTINSKEKIFSEKRFLLIFNDTKSPTITFKSDMFFNKKGFLLYFQGKFLKIKFNFFLHKY